MDNTKLWGGRFDKSPSEALRRLSALDPRHLRLVGHDLRASEAHAAELQRAGILSNEEVARLVTTLRDMRSAVDAGTLRPNAHDEDIHTFCERVLVERLGDLGGTLRAGRSRNDQAANDLKLYLRDAARELARSVLDLIDALQGQARQHIDSIAPGFTHLQSAQPIVFGHQLLAHAQALVRDIGRWCDWDLRHAVSPLGAAALAGSSLALSPERSAAELGYLASAENSIDAVGARDHVTEFLFVCAQCAVHVSRLAEELTLWASQQFGWIRLDDAFATGSSIMPQKRNPDIAELARGRSARLIGDLTAMLTVLKGLPLAYNRDLSDDKHYSFDAVDTLNDVLPAMAGLVRTMQVDRSVLEAQATAGHSLATEVADCLARRGVPFARAHEIAGALVRASEARGVGLAELSDDELVAVSPNLTPDVRAVLEPRAAVDARHGRGGTAPAAVSAQLDRLAARLLPLRSWAATSVCGQP